MNRTSGKSRKTRGPRRPSGKRNSPMIKIERMEHPPQINQYETFMSRRLRYTVTAAATNAVITFQNILDANLVATTATVGYDLYDIVRINQVEVWSQAALGTPSTIVVSYVTTSGDRAIQTDTSLGVKPAYVKAVPSKTSLASFFSASGAGNAFLVTCPAGSILDLSVELRTTNAAATVAQNALVAATAGEFYFRGLDGLASATTNFPPIAGVAAI